MTCSKRSTWSAATATGDPPADPRQEPLRAGYRSRAAQLTPFSMLMKGRADDRRLFERGVKLNVMAFVDSAGFDAVGFSECGGGSGLRAEAGGPHGVEAVVRARDDLWVADSGAGGVGGNSAGLKQLSQANSQDLFVSEALKRLGPLVQQAELLATQYDAVVANSANMGSKFYCLALKRELSGKKSARGTYLSTSRHRTASGWPRTLSSGNDSHRMLICSGGLSGRPPGGG